MTKFFAKIDVSNDAEQPCVVWIEPWAEDFTLLAHQSVEVRVHSSLALPSFNVVHHNHGLQVYVEIEAAGTPTEVYLKQCTFEVFQDAVQIHCGHNRQAAIDAGIPM